MEEVTGDTWDEVFPPFFRGLVVDKGKQKLKDEESMRMAVLIWTLQIILLDEDDVLKRINGETISDEDYVLFLLNGDKKN